MAVSIYLVVFWIMVLLLLLLRHHVKHRKFWKYFNEFHGSNGLPFIGNALEFGTIEDGNDFLAKTYEYSRMAGHRSYKFRLGHVCVIGLCDPESIEVVLSSTKEINKMDDYTMFNSWLGDGLLMSSGAKWRIRRKIITPTFHFKILREFVKVFEANSAIFVTQLSQHTGKLIDISPFINRHTLDVMCEAAMGVSVNAQIDHNSEYVLAVKRFISSWKRINWLYKLSNDYRQARKVIKVLHGMTNSVIRARKEKLRDQIERVRKGEPLVENQEEFIGIKNKIAFLDLLLLSKLPDGSFLSEEDVREEVDTFMFEGHDTTSTAMSFAIYELANNPDIQQKVLDEVISIVGANPLSPITYEQLLEMKYMEMFIKETLRLYPSVAEFGRRIENDLLLPDGKIIPAGCNVLIDAFSLGRNPRYYPNCDKFDPERFSPENTLGKNPYLFVSFSAGSRNCIGQKFAMLELKTLLARLLMNYELVSGGENVKPRLIQEVILKPYDGVKIIVKDRKLINGI